MSTKITKDPFVHTAVYKENGFRPNLKQGYYWLLYTYFSHVYFGSVESEDIHKVGKTTLMYIKGSKLNFIKAYQNGKLVDEVTFLRTIGLSINKSDNLQTLGKRLGRLFRVVKHGRFFKSVSIKYVSDANSNYRDAISTISLKFARRLYKRAKVGDRVSLTVVYDGGELKSHAIIKLQKEDIISHELNLKKEISLDNGKYYVSVDELKLGTDVWLDSQTLMNIFEAFNLEELQLKFAEYIINLRNSILNGTYLEIFENVPELRNEFLLHKIGVRRINYTYFRSLFKRVVGLAFQRVDSKLEKDRLPLKGAIRPYITPDLNGNLKKGEALLEGANLFVNLKDYNKMMLHLGTADADDSVMVIPITKGYLIVRNPNSIGEHFVLNTIYGFEPEFRYSINTKKLPQFVAPEEHHVPTKKVKKDKTVSTLDKVSMTMSKDLSTKADTITQMSISYVDRNGLFSMIGAIANATYIASVIRIQSGKNFSGYFDISAEVDAVNMSKGSSIAGKKIKEFYEMVVSKGYKIPSIFLDRIPLKYRGDVAVNKNSRIERFFNEFTAMAEKTKEICNLAANGEKVSLHVGDKPKYYLNLLPVSRESSDLGKRAEKAYFKYSDDIRMARSIASSEEELTELVNSVNSDYSRALSLKNDEDKMTIIKRWLFLSRGKDDRILWVDGITDETIEVLFELGFAHQIEPIIDESVDVVAFEVYSNMKFSKIGHKHWLIRKQQ